MKKLLIISYYANMPGACQAEWLDDKIDSIKQTSYFIDVISSSCAEKYNNEIANHWRIASISFSDFLDERRRVLATKRKLRIVDWFMLPLIVGIGIVIDLIQFIFTKGLGEGRWSWTLSAFIATIVVCLLNRPNSILSTGGPASAHLAAIAAGKLFRLPVIVELQDPLSGQGIGRNVQVRGWLRLVESLIIRYATKVVYVTEGAARFAKYQFNANNIIAVYPGAKDFNIRYTASSEGGQKFRLVHLGSLYANRNFSTIIAAIDVLIRDNIISADEVELINLGHVADHIRRDILKKDYVKILPPIGRFEALQFAASCNATLLIQNSDERSQVTIPYKTYDYLNIKTPIIALLNSEELTKLIKDSGNVALDIGDVESTSKALLNLIKNKEKYISETTFVNPKVQSTKLLALT